MSINPLACLENQKNIGLSQCKKMPQLIKGVIVTPFDFELTEEEANDIDNWQDALLADKRNRIVLFPIAKNMEQLNEDTVYEETALGVDVVRAGRYRFRLMFSESLEVHKRIWSFRGFNGRMFLVDTQNKITGTQKTNGNFAGFTLDLLNPEKALLNDGSVRTKTPVYFSLADNLELDDNGAMIDGSFVRSLVPLTSAKLEVQGTPTATEIVVDVKSVLDNTPILGLIVDDFILLDASGASISIDSITESQTIEGRYTLTGTAFATGTLNLVEPADLSIVGFEGEAVEITI